MLDSSLSFSTMFILKGRSMLTCVWSSGHAIEKVLSYGSFFFSSYFFLFMCAPVRWVYREISLWVDIHGHRTLKAPHPVRSAQLTRVPPS